MLSIIIAAHNEPDLGATIESIQRTAPPEVEIVIVDDASKVPVPHFPGVMKRAIRNSRRMGVGPSRHIGILAACQPWVLITDGHMRFVDGWYKAFESVVDGSDGQTAWCGQCLGLDHDNLDVSNCRGRYFGATWNFHGPDRNNEKITQTFEPIWAGEQAGDKYELPAMMGALYLLPRRLYLRLGGLQHLREWGMDEAMLSLKIWLSGGEIRMLKGLQAGHVFWYGEKRPYPVRNTAILYNKLFAIRTLLPADAANVLIGFLAQDRYYNSAATELAEIENYVELERRHNALIFNREFDWYVNKFGLRFPQT